MRERGLRRSVPPRMTLRALRTAARKTQAEVARVTGIAQGDLSRLETRDRFDDSLVSTLRRYVEALGGGVELVVVFPQGHRLTIIPAGKGKKAAR